MPAAAPPIAHRNPIQSVRSHLSRQASERRHRGRMQWVASAPPPADLSMCQWLTLEEPSMGCGSTPGIPVAHVDGASGGTLSCEERDVASTRGPLPLTSANG